MECLQSAWTDFKGDMKENRHKDFGKSEFLGLSCKNYMEQ
jgi:hypothetical protein